MPQTKNIEINGEAASLDFSLNRWIDPSKRGYWSGDHHIHAAGCAHYTDPAEGVVPEVMFRQILGLRQLRSVMIHREQAHEHVVEEWAVSHVLAELVCPGVGAFDVRVPLPLGDLKTLG